MAWQQPRLLVEGHTFDIVFPALTTYAMWQEVTVAFRILYDGILAGTITTLEQVRAVPMPPGCTLRLHRMADAEMTGALHRAPVVTPGVTTGTAGTPVVASAATEHAMRAMIVE